MGSGRFLYRERNKGKSLEADTNNIVNTCTAANSEQADDMMLAEGIDIQKSSKRISNNMVNFRMPFGIYVILLCLWIIISMWHVACGSGIRCFVTRVEKLW